MKKIKLCLLFIFIPIIMTGCWDKVEPEERGYVITLGVDKDKKGDFLVSIELPQMNIFDENSDSKKTEENQYVESISGKSFWDTLKKIDSYTEKELNFAQTKVCILGEELLKDKKMFKEVLDALERSKDIGRRLIIIGTEETAKDILSGYTGQNKLAGFYISDFYNKNFNGSETTVKKDFQKILGELSASGNTVIPKAYISDGEVKLNGIGVIGGSRLLDWASGDILNGYLLVKEKIMNNDIVTKFEGHDVPMRISSKNTDIRFEESSQKLICYIDIEVSGSIEEFEDRNYNQTLPYDKLQKSFETTISQNIEKSFDFFQNEVKTDALEFKEICRKKYYDLFLKYGQNWNNTFQNMELRQNVSVKISGAGSIK